MRREIKDKRDGLLSWKHSEASSQKRQKDGRKGGGETEDREKGRAEDEMSYCHWRVQLDAFEINKFLYEMRIRTRSYLPFSIVHFCAVAFQPYKLAFKYSYVSLFELHNMSTHIQTINLPLLSRDSITTIVHHVQYFSNLFAIYCLYCLLSQMHLQLWPSHFHCMGLCAMTIQVYLILSYMAEQPP